MWNLPLSLVTVDRAEEGRIQLDPGDANFYAMKELLAPYIAFSTLKARSIVWLNTRRTGRSNLIGVMTSVFMNLAAHRNFGPYDNVELETAGDKIAVTIHLHGPQHGTQPDGWSGEGIEAGALHLTFGDVAVYDRLAVRTTRTLWSDALNALSLMLPNLSKGKLQ